MIQLAIQDKLRPSRTTQGLFSHGLAVIVYAVRVDMDQTRPTKAVQVQKGLLDALLPRVYHILLSIKMLICENLCYATINLKKVTVLDLYSDLMILMYHTYLAILQ